MDIERFKKLSNSKIEAGRTTRDVRNELKKYKEVKQDAYEGLVETFKPVIEAQKNVKQSIDEKQDQLISQLQNNQNKIVRAIEFDPKKAITYEGELLPSLDYEDNEDKEKTTKHIIFNLDKGISKAYKTFLSDKGLDFQALFLQKEIM